MTRKYDEKNTVQMHAEPVFGVQINGSATLSTHRKEDCVGPHCCVHNPSDHPLNQAPLNWRGDRGLMERICEHGIGHPDPDDIAYKWSVYGEEFAKTDAVHGCDGCCAA